MLGALCTHGMAAAQMMGPRSVILLDEMSTGLDSATLFTVIRWFAKVSSGSEQAGRTCLRGHC